MQWTLLNNQTPKNQKQLEEILLKNRQIPDPDIFFNPPHPFSLTLQQLNISEVELEKALQILVAAKKENKKIIIYGDYDADGISATAILWRIMYDLGFQVTPFIPDRQLHGYGLTPAAVEAILTEHEPQLVITVDNGIVAHESIQELKKHGLQVIVTDHHSPEETLPPADAIFHSTKACGASVAWTFAREILRQQAQTNASLNVEKIANQQLDLCGLATIADQVPLSEPTNRAFAKWGVAALKESNRVGLLELLTKAGIKQIDLDANTVNFALAPRINAMGRLKHGLDALKLLCTKNLKQAQQLTEELTQTNVLRQDITYTQVALAEAQVASQLDQKLLFVQSEQFHEGVIGLIAGKLMEKHHKPAIVVSYNNATGVGKASARSIAGINIVELIRTAKDDLLAVGGHPMAAGFGVAVEKINQVKENLQLTASKIDAALFNQEIKLECNLPANLVNKKTLIAINRFSPFGQKNREPIFGFSNLTVLEANSMGKEKEHLKMLVHDDKQFSIPIIAWRMGNRANDLASGDKVNIAGIISENIWRDKSTYQIIAKDIVKLD